MKFILLLAITCLSVSCGIGEPHSQKIEAEINCPVGTQVEFFNEDPETTKAKNSANGTIAIGYRCVPVQ